MEQKSIAIIGSGISGILSAHLLSKRYNVTLFEARPKLGGHANTVFHNGLGIDTGFIVFNELNYPIFTRFLAELDVAYQPSDMSFGYYDATTPFWWCSDVPDGLFSQTKNIVSWRHWCFLAQISRFNAQVKVDLDNGAITSESLDSYLTHRGVSDDFKAHYILPMGAAIWSCPESQIGAFPALSFFQFWNNHRLLNTLNRPQWQTVTGGSRSYIDAFTSQFSGTIKCDAPIQSIRRDNDHVVVTQNGQEPERFDHVVIATHANQALKLLDDPTEKERQLLSRWQYSINNVVLHTDPHLMPPKKSGWASWLVHRHSKGERLTMTYYMNRLQSLQTTTDYFVSLNATDQVSPNGILTSLTYTHPIYTPDSLATQSQLSHLNTQHTSFCGSYFGYGFHEDGARAALAVANSLGVQW